MSFDVTPRPRLSPVAPAGGDGGSDDEGTGEWGPPTPPEPESSGTSPEFTRSIIQGGSSLPAGAALAEVYPGQVIFGRYRVIRQLGRGGMGSVWLVHHLDLDTPRALKMIVSGFGDGRMLRARLRREARVMAQFNHPHAVTIHDARFANEMTFLDMEYLEGKSLQQVLHARAPMPADWTARVLEQVCDVLQAAHDRGIIHRDMKPSNLMLLDGRPTGREFVKVTDFGIAKIVGQDDLPHGPATADDMDDVDMGHTTAGSFLGTPIYSSPEQIRAEPLDHRTDVYSLGVVLYQMLTGRRPFEGPIAQLLAAQMSMPPPPMKQANPTAEVPAKIEELVLSCLEKEPARRPQSARELSERFLWSLPPRFRVASGGGGTSDGGGAHLRPPPGYRLVRCLGKGGFGEVWEAIDEEAVRVALKFVRLDDDLVGEAEWDALQIIKNIRHPNLLVPFKSWQSPEHLVIGMELAEGTLRQRYDQARRDGHPGIPRDELIEHLREAAKGLDFLNESRHELESGRRGAIYHCDVKPQNILLMGGAVKVADFGLSRFTDHSITGRDAAMTVQYAAPEFLNRKASRYSDQYSLAVTYCFLRGGRLPFSGDNVQALMIGHLKREPDLAMLPASEQAPVARALKKNPRARFPNCRSFVDALAAIEDRTSDFRRRPSGWRTAIFARLARLWPARRDPFGDTTEDWPATRSRKSASPDTRSTETETPRDDKPPKPADAELRDF